MKILVTGVAGFIGSHLAEALKKDHNIIGIDNFFTGKKENVPEGITFHKMDINEDLNEIIEGVDAVFHLAAIPMVQYSIDNPSKSHLTNVDGTLNLLEFSKKNKVKKFIFSSSGAVYGDNLNILKEEYKTNPISPYALHKDIGERYCKLFSSLYNLNTISLRYLNVFGERQNSEGGYANIIPKFIKSMRSGETPTINGDGEQTRDFIYVSDVVEANIRALHSDSNSGEVFNIGSGKETSVNQIFEILKNNLNFKESANHGPSVIEPRRALADITNAKKVLAWKPQISLEGGLKMLCDSQKA